MKLPADIPGLRQIIVTNGGRFVGLMKTSARLCEESTSDVVKTSAKLDGRTVCSGLILQRTALRKLNRTEFIDSLQ